MDVDQKSVKAPPAADRAEGKSPACQFQQQVAAMPYGQQVAALQPSMPLQFNLASGAAVGSPYGGSVGGYGAVQMDTSSGVAGDAEITEIKAEDTLTSEHYTTFKARYDGLVTDIKGSGGDAQALWLSVVRKLQQTNAEWKSAPTVDTARGKRTELESTASQNVIRDLTGIIGEVRGLMDIQARGIKEWSFWSGRPARYVATTIGTCLETSALGALFDNININGSWDIGLWGALSRSYAEAVARNLQDDSVLRGFVGQGSSNEQSLFNKIEQPKFKSICEERGLTPTVTWYACVGMPGDVGKVDETEVAGGVKGCAGTGDRASMVALAESENARRAAMPKSSAVQPLGGEASGSTASIHQTAAQGVSGSGGSLPHLDKVQQSFGAFDVSNVQAHVGGKAAEASSALGAQAYASGNNVAFKSTPSLHTAAHEAAHVVQQRSGVNLSGGVGKAGDSYERHADAVADAVVSGKSAEPLLAGGSGAAASLQRSVQMRHGDLGTAAGEDLLRAACAQKGVSYEAAVAWAQEKHGAEFHFVTVEDAVQFLYRRASRDTYFNNALKVNFEGQLAARLLRASSFYQEHVTKVSGACLAYIDKKAQEEGVAAAELINGLSGMYGGKVNEAGQRVNNWEQDLYYGRLGDDLMSFGATVEEAKANFATEMRGVFSGDSGSIPQQVFGHHQFWDHVYKSDAPRVKRVGEQLVEIGKSRATQYIEELNAEGAELEAVGQKTLRYGAGTDNAPNAFGVDADGGRVSGVGQSPTDASKPADMRGRYARDDHGDTRVDSSSGIRARGTNDSSVSDPQAPTEVKLGEEHGGGQRHNRGVDRWTMDERQAFIQEARVLLDMPLGGGVSGTTTDLMEVSQFAGLSGNKEKFGYALAVFAHLASAGAHSFHEIMVAASTAGIPYVPGDYYSTLQQLGAFDIAEVKELTEQEQYKEVKGISGPV